jgi:RNA polymerase sigma-70 factor, ECF subfamily
MWAILALPLRISHRRRNRQGAADDAELLTRFRSGDEQAFVALVARHHAAMLRLAGTFVPSGAVAEEVVQETWFAALRGIDKFAGRSSFKTWLFAILVNRARSAGMREHRSIPLDDAGPAVDAARFDATGRWASPPQHWIEDSDERLAAQALSGTLQGALERLPARQRLVVLLRDVDGFSSDEVCRLLEISEGNQRVLLHRGRSHLRGVIEAEFGRI